MAEATPRIGVRLQKTYREGSVVPCRHWLGRSELQCATITAVDNPTESASKARGSTRKGGG